MSIDSLVYSVEEKKRKIMIHSFFRINKHERESGHIHSLSFYFLFLEFAFESLYDEATAGIFFQHEKYLFTGGGGINWNQDIIYFILFFSIFQWIILYLPRNRLLFIHSFHFWLVYLPSGFISPDLRKKPNLRFSKNFCIDTTAKKKGNELFFFLKKVFSSAKYFSRQYIRCLGKL